MRVTVGKKISGGFLIVNIMVILMSIFAYFEVGLINSSYETAMDTNLERIGIVQEFSAALANEAVAIRRYNASGDAADQAMYKDYKRKTDAGITKLEERIHTDSGKNRIQLIKTNKSEYETNADKSIEARKNNNLEQAGVFMQEAGKPYKLAIANTEELVNDVTLSVNSDKAKQSENARHIQLVLIVVNILVTVVATGIGLFISRSIANPIRRITVTADEIAKGNLNQPDILVNSSDEISEVAKSFNIMKNNLKDLLKKIASATDHVAASSQQLTASSEQSADATNQVAGTISEVALGAESQASAADLAYQAVVQLTEHIQQVAKNAGEVSGVAEKTSLAATQGDSAVNAAIEQMETIEHTVANSAQIVKKLGDSSQEIGQIVSTIAGISGQTNLLALNAAIEAARAGEQGRGFAVVAEEVRKLAEQSQEAAKQIADLINAIQSDTDQAVEAMNAGAHEVKTGAEVVNNAGRAFKEIVSLIEEVTSQIRKITTAIQQMNSGSEQIVHSVRDIERISKVAAGQTQTVAAATEEQSASIEEIAASSQALARVADELQQAVAIFKVATK